MLKKHLLAFMPVLFLLAACSGQPPQEPFVTQTLAPTREFIIFTPIPKTVDVTPAHTLLPTVIVQILPTQSPTLVNIESLPKLSKVIISSADSENIDELSYNPLLQVTDTTSELQGYCLWDCVKHQYSLEQGTLTIMLLRTGDTQKAESTVDNVRKEFLKTVGVEYTASDIPSMPSNSWVIVDAASNTKDFRMSAAGTVHGSVVILVTYRQRFCENTSELGRYCEGDLMGLGLTSIDFLNAQIEKLEAAGYPK